MSSQLQVSGEAKIRDIQGPVVANSGVITALDGAASQYVRGDGTLADFPTSSGGGSSVSYYLNSSVSQGTIGGVAYRELSKEPIIGAGTDIAISANGYVASYLTDANDPDVLSIPGGNFNCEFYFSVNNETGNPFFYAELYKYDGTTFTLLGSSVGVPEYINQGTIIAPYYFAIPVPTSALALTDRLAIRIYVNVDGRTVTLHTENGHLCQVVTTLSKGMVSLNNLTDQSQFLTTGTSGTNFAIVSSGDTHTFNLPIASATNTGKLSSTDWSTFNNKVPYTGATADVDLGAFILSAGATSSNIVYANGSGSSSGMLYLKQGIIAANYTGYNGIYATSTSYGFIADTGSSYKLGVFSLASLTNATTRTYTLPDISGTLALLEQPQTFSGLKTFDLGLLLKENVIPSSVGYTGLSGDANGLIISKRVSSTTYTNLLYFNNTTSNTYTFPNASGTIALTSNLSFYVPYSGATSDVNLGVYSITSNLQTNRGVVVNDSSGTANALNLKTATSGQSISGAGYVSLVSSTVNYLSIFFGNSTVVADFNASIISARRTYTLPNASGTIALLSGTQTFTGATTFTSDITVTGVRVGKGAGSLSGNTALGEFSLTANTTGNQNTGIGFGTLFTNTTGQQNTALGNVALTTNSTGNNNTAIGFSTLISNTTGSNNTVIGSSAGSSITTGSNNTIIGTYSGTPTLANNIVLADGAGNIRYQWDGTNNVFGNPISGTSATFSTSISTSNLLTIVYADISTGNNRGLRIVNTDATEGTAYNITSGRTGQNNGDFVIRNTTTGVNNLVFNRTTSAATFSSSVGIKVSGRSESLAVEHSTGNVSAGFFYNTGIATGQSYGLTVYAGTNASDRSFLVSNQGGANTYLYVRGDGNVGIGTSIPSSFVEMSKSSNSGSGGTFPRLAIKNTLATQGDGSSTFNFADILISSGNDSVNMFLATTYAAGTWAPAGIINVSTNHDLQIKTNNTPRMQITSGGNVFINATSGGNEKFNVTQSGAQWAMALNHTNSTQFFVDFRNNGTQTGSIIAGGGVTAYNTTSDYRLKEDFQDVNGLEKISLIKVYNFKLKNYDNRMDGFIAHELQKVVPYAVSGEKDGEMMQGVDYSKLTPINTKAIQELYELIKEQQAQIEELKELIKNK